MKYKYSKIYWFLRSFEWMRVYFSPFKFFLPKLYLGKVAVGTPHFLPRVWKKATPQRAREATKNLIKREEDYNKLNPKYARKIKSYEEIYKDKMKYSYSDTKKIGFDFTGLGWKTKWSSTDFRHEWNPIWSFVFFDYQIALIFAPENDCHYWESYLFYHYATDRNTSVKERINYARKKFPNIWTSHSEGDKVTTNYWDVSLKNKYLK